MNGYGSTGERIPVMEDRAMGKGDQRSRRGKIWRGTFGKSRPRKVRESAPQKAAPKKTAKKTSR